MPTGWDLSRREFLESMLVALGAAESSEHLAIIGLGLFELALRLQQIAHVVEPNERGAMLVAPGAASDLERLAKIGLGFFQLALRSQERAHAVHRGDRVG